MTSQRRHTEPVFDFPSKVPKESGTAHMQLDSHDRTAFVEGVSHVTLVELVLGIYFAKLKSRHVRNPTYMKLHVPERVFLAPPIMERDQPILVAAMFLCRQTSKGGVARAIHVSSGTCLT